MKAITLYETKGPEGLRLEDVPRPKPGPFQVLIELKYAALNRRDYFITHGLYPGIELPCILGSDGAGIVSETGKEVMGLEKGTEVIINPSLDWGESPRVSSPQFNILGVPRDGTFAQYIVIGEKNVYPKPKHMSLEEASAVPLAALTAYRALFSRGGLLPGETVLIPGIGGGVATYVLQMAAAYGAHAYVTSGSDAKLEQATKLGAKAGVNYRTKEWSKVLSEKLGGGADLCIDSIGGEVFKQLVKLAKPGGRIVTFGATAGPVNELLMPHVFMKQLDIRGTTMGTNEEFKEMIAFIEQHALRPVVDRTYELEETMTAIEQLGRGNQFGKIVLRIP